MTTVPLSRRIDALFGIRVGAISGPFSPLPVHPESPVLLTKTSPPTVVDFASGVRSGDPGSLPVRSSRIGRGRYGPGTSSRSLYRSKRFRDGRYPEGNFGGNQLLGGSIGLSPLFARRTNDLHVSTVDGPPPGFPPASPRARIDHHLSGPDAGAPARSASRTSGRRRRPPAGGRPAVRFRCADGPLALSLARALDSLVRVSRRVGRDRLAYAIRKPGVEPRRGARLRPEPRGSGTATGPSGSTRCPATRSPSPSGRRRASGRPPGASFRASRGDLSFGATPVPRKRPRRRAPPDPRRAAAPGGEPSGTPRRSVGRARATTRSRRSGPLPPLRFRALLTPLSRFFSPFRRRTCSLSASPTYLALDETYHPIRAALSSGPTLRCVRSSGTDRARTGNRPPCLRPSRRIGTRPAPSRAHPLHTPRPPREPRFGLGIVRFARRY
jgi:hypothetical protein